MTSATRFSACAGCTSVSNVAVRPKIIAALKGSQFIIPVPALVGRPPRALTAHALVDKPGFGVKRLGVQRLASDPAPRRVASFPNRQCGDAKSVSNNAPDVDEKRSF